MSAKLVQHLRPGDYSKSVGSLHLVFHAVGKLLDFFRFLDHVHGEDMLIGLVDVGLQVNCQSEQFVGVVFESNVTLLIGLLRHVARESRPRVIFFGGRRTQIPARWGWLRRNLTPARYGQPEYRKQ